MGALLVTALLVAALPGCGHARAGSGGVAGGLCPEVPLDVRPGTDGAGLTPSGTDPTLEGEAGRGGSGFADGGDDESVWREGPPGWRALAERAERVRAETDAALSLPSEDPTALFGSRGGGGLAGGPAEAFRLSGAVRRVGYGALTVTREALPPTVLEVRPGTRIELNGEPVPLSELPEGASVRALFQLEGSAPVALEVSARSLASPDAPPSAGAALGSSDVTGAASRATSDGVGRERERHPELDVAP